MGLSFLLIFLLLAGCADEVPIPMKITKNGIVRDKEHTGYVPAWSRDDLPGYVGTPGSGQLGRDIVDSDPLLKGVPQEYSDPYLEGGQVPDSVPKKDPLDAFKDPMTSHSRPGNWYWLRGRIQNGEVAIRVNGRPAGTFAVHADLEITDLLHLGGNSIEFRPLPRIPSKPVNAHIELIYSQQARSEPPVLIYDTGHLNGARDLLPDTHAPQIGGPDFAADPNEPSAQGNQAVLGPRNEIMEFVAH